MALKSYRDLRVWQLAIDLVKEVCLIHQLHKRIRSENTSR